MVDKIKVTEINGKKYVSTDDIEQLFREMEKEKGQTILESDIDEEISNDEILRMVSEVTRPIGRVGIFADGTQLLPGDVIKKLRGGEI